MTMPKSARKSICATQKMFPRSTRHPLVHCDPCLTSEPPAPSLSLHTNHSQTHHRGTSHITVHCTAPRGPLSPAPSATPILLRPRREEATIGLTQTHHGPRSIPRSQRFHPFEPLIFPHSIALAGRPSRSRVPPAPPTITTTNRSSQTTTLPWTRPSSPLPSRPFPRNSRV